MKRKSWSLLKYNKFLFGTQPVSQFVVFESKYLFSIIFFYFHKSNGEQDRYHTHAFNALSFKLFGSYEEHCLVNKVPETFTIKRRKSFFKFFPRDSYHKIAKSNGCCTILLSGPWKKEWEEFLDNKTYKYNWNRKNGS